jgi:hypothetical protein
MEEEKNNKNNCLDQTLLCFMPRRLSIQENLSVEELVKKLPNYP